MQIFKGLVFKDQEFKGTYTVMSIDKPDNTVHLKLTPSNSKENHWMEGWDLSWVVTGIQSKRLTVIGTALDSEPNDIEFEDYPDRSTGCAKVATGFILFLLIIVGLVIRHYA
jgi:hypothetical protein